MRQLLIVFALVAGCEGVSAPVVLKGATCTVSIVATPPSITVEDLAGNVLLQSAQPFLSATLDTPSFTPEVTPGWDGYVAHEAPWSGAQNGIVESNDGTSASLGFVASPYGATLDVALTDTGATITANVSGGANELALAWVLPADEHFFGLGERFASIDHRGLGLYAWAEEGGTGSGENVPLSDDNPYPNGPSMTYFPVPYHYSTAGYAMHIDTTDRTVMHMGDEDPNEWRVTVNGTSLPLVLYANADPLTDLDAYTNDTGRPVIPADWVWGNWRRIDRGAMVDGEDEYQLMRDRQIPITTIEDALHFLPALSFIGIEDQVKAWTQAVHGAGYKVLAYNNPYVAANQVNAHADYTYGAGESYFEEAPNGDPATTFFISGALLTVSAIDLTNDNAVTWFQSLLRRTFDYGYDGWQHDFGEYVQREDHFADGRSGSDVHNDYPRLSAKAAYDFASTAKPNDFVFHVRSGTAGSQSYAPVVWGGDAEATFDETQGLPSALRAGVNLGMSGVSTWGSDMTGFKCLTSAPNDKEVFFRWVEFGAVSPIMREENACENPLETKTKWSLWNDDDTQTMYRAMASLHTRLAPYLRTLASVANTNGTPIMRHPVLYFPKLVDAWAVDDAYFFGPAFYAARVVRRGVTMRSVWLPPGQYLEWTDGTVWNGPGAIISPAPLDRLPLFLVADQLVPMLDPDVQTLAASAPGVIAESDRATVLDVVLALSKTGSADLTMSDGTNLTVRHDAMATPNTTATTDPTQLQTCNDCSLIDTFGDVPRVRATSAQSTSSTLVVDGLALSVTSPLSRQIRWDVRLLP